MSEQYAFFGSRATPPLQIATSEEGFLTEASRGVANNANPCLYGSGCYFAHSARYSHKYAHRLATTAGEPDLHQLLVVQVICGKSKVFTGTETDPSMNRMKLTDEFDSGESDFFYIYHYI